MIRYYVAAEDKPGLRWSYNGCWTYTPGFTKYFSDRKEASACARQFVGAKVMTLKATRSEVLRELRD